MPCSISSLRCWCIFLALLCLFTSRCHSDPDAAGVVARAMACFSDQSVYSGCQEAYRLSAQGALNVPPEATDSFCGGPCLDETKLVLSCVNDILYTFKFYNGASVRDVRYTLDAGCGHSSRRGDFNVQHFEDNPFSYGYYDPYNYYDHGTKFDVPVYLTTLLISFVLLLL